MIQAKWVEKCIGSLLIISFFFLVLVSLEAEAQDLLVINELESSVDECSGLHYLGDRLIGIQDSDNPAQIFEIDSESAQVNRVVHIQGATNTDWESITADESFIYIGDIGNNQGTRQDLRIYKISIEDYLDESNIVEDFEIISFTYTDQDDFSPNEFQTNFDAEAICSYGESLLLFSKSWGNGYSKIYEISKVPGAYNISPVDSLDAQGLVTGCNCNAENHEITLIGHSISLIPFSIRINNFDSEDLDNANILRSDLSFPNGTSPQIESLAQDSEYIVASESLFLVPGWLFSLEWPGVLYTKNIYQKESIQPIFPNPSKDAFKVQNFNYSSIHILAENGQELFQSPKKDEYYHNLPTGSYIVVFKLGGEFIISTKLLIIN